MTPSRAAEVAARLPAWSPALPAALAYLLINPPSADLAVQRFRADLGLVVWDNAWYGGHHIPAYSILFPPLAQLLDARLVGALSAIAAAWLFGRLVDGLPGARTATVWFALGAVSTLVSGRLTFALGVALALAATLALSRARPALALIAALATSLASPVAGAFLALVAVSWWLSERASWRLWVAAAALAPALALALAFPEGGSFPFAPSSFWPALAALVALWLAIPARYRAIRLGVALYAIATAASFALDTPMGGNVVRLGSLFAGPLLAALIWRGRRLAPAAVALGIALLYWQWAAPIDDWRRASGDASVHARYYGGLLRFLGAQQDLAFRVEIPFTDNHWESRWVAPHVPLARGWERQLDIARNGLFYDGRPLTAARYRAWLDENAVRFIALADAPLDYSAAEEAALVRSGLPYLRAVWRDAHWRVYAVARATPVASGAGVAAAIGRDRVALTVSRPGSVYLRVRWSPYWELRRGRGCVRRADGGWTRIDARGVGPIELAIGFSPWRIGTRSPRCSG